MKLLRTQREIRRCRNVAYIQRDYTKAELFAIVDNIMKIIDKVNYHGKTISALCELSSDNHKTLKGIAAAMLEHVGSETAHGLDDRRDRV